MELLKPQWRTKTLNQLKYRNKVEHQQLKKLFERQTDLLNKVHTLQLENIQLTSENQILKNSQLLGTLPNLSGSENLMVQQLERKVYNLQEELTNIHRQRSDNAEQMLEVSRLVQEKEKLIAVVQNKLAFGESEMFLAKEDLSLTKEKLKKSEDDYQFMVDEFNALNLLYDSLEKKYKKSQAELNDVVDRWMVFKAKDVDRMNEENEAAAKRTQEKMEVQIREASREVKNINEESKYASESPFCLTVNLPDKPFSYKFVHEGHINALKHTHSGIFLASGGSDQIIKVWKVGRDSLVKECSLNGCNAAITSIDFSSNDSCLLASSNDFASYIWTLSDHRVRNTLTGHTGKVLAARFLPDDSFIISGSYDRTLKLWDIRNTKCVRTYFPGSSCNDIVVTQSQAHTVISGHFDKNIRLYDTRSDDTKPIEVAVCQGKITSLSLSRDGTFILCSARDDTIKMVDLRTRQVLQSYTAETFHIGADYVRASFSPDEAFVACGSNTGDIFIWNTATGVLEKTLCDEKHCVLDCSWNPNGKLFFSSDKNHTITSWS